MDEELAFHLESRTRDLIRGGIAPEEAARRARIELGGVTTQKENMRASLGLRLWDDLRADLRYALRMLRKNPAFTAVAALSLAVAIGANTTIFSLTQQLLYQRLDVRHPEELRLLAWTTAEQGFAPHVWGDRKLLPGGRIGSTAFSYPAFLELRAQDNSPVDLFAFKAVRMDATIGRQAQRVETEMVSGNFYSALGVYPQLGRPIQPSDNSGPGQGAVAVISDGLWERAFARSPHVLGETIKLNDVTLTIIGVNPKGFTGARSVLKSPDVFVPLTMQPLLEPTTVRGAVAAHGGKPYSDALGDASIWWVYIMGRLQPGVDAAVAQAALTGKLAAIVRGTMPMWPRDQMPRLELRDGSRGLFLQQKTYAKPMTVLMTLASFVLLLACANIANLMLARAAGRLREMSVRIAMGAGRTRIVRQMLVESLLLAAIGGAGGLLASYLGRNAIPKLMITAWERSDFHVRFDWRVFAFTAGVTILTGILFGLAPAFSAARVEPGRSLKETSQTVTRRKGLGGKSLVVFQIALATLLVVGAGLYLRTLAGLNAVDVGFRTDHLLLAEINPPQGRYPRDKDIELYQKIEQAFAAMPGVESVAPATIASVSGDYARSEFLPEGTAHQQANHEEAFNVVGDRFFATLGIPILSGRAFGPQDTRDSAKVGIINESLAREQFPEENPIGKFFTTNEWKVQIVGVCGDTRYSNLRQSPPPQFYLPYVQQPGVRSMTYEVRTRVTPDTIVPTLRRVVSRIDPDLPLVNVRTQDQQINEDLAEERIFAMLTSGFGLLALALAAIGIYGVMAYSVSERTNEIGVRMALGALPGQVRGMILQESALLAVAGITVGIAAVLALMRLIQSMLFGIQFYDPLTLFAGVGILLVVALGAGWIPARRAASVQPMAALRHE
jgi:predicted permease